MKRNAHARFRTFIAFRKREGLPLPRRGILKRALEMRPALAVRLIRDERERRGWSAGLFDDLVRALRVLKRARRLFRR